MDGLQATRKIKGNECCSHIPVIILSAGVFAEERSAAKEAGADDFLSKPINLSELKAVLSRYARTADIPTHQ
jgi:CheY-like chemotaxis protein